MTITDEDRLAAETRLRDETNGRPRAVRGRYDRRSGKIVVTLDSGLELAFPPRLAEGLAGAAPEALSRIEIGPLGDGLHWPNLDADLYLPSLLDGVFGSHQWMARQLGGRGGRVRSPAKAAASRRNGAKGGRPRKMA